MIADAMAFLLILHFVERPNRHLIWFRGSSGWHRNNEWLPNAWQGRRSPLTGFPDVNWRNMVWHVRFDMIRVVYHYSSVLSVTSPSSSPPSTMIGPQEVTVQHDESVREIIGPQLNRCLTTLAPVFATFHYLPLMSHNMSHDQSLVTASFAEKALADLLVVHHPGQWSAFQQHENGRAVV